MAANSSSAAVRHLPAVTTPFQVPSNCHSKWATTLTLTSLGRSQVTEFTPILISDVARTSCLPSQWQSSPESASPESVLSKGALFFSPGVCPESWTYYNVGAHNGTDSKVTSTATCCDQCVSPKMRKWFLQSSPCEMADREMSDVGVTVWTTASTTISGR